MPGHWTLKPSTALADGTYDMTAEVSDGINPAIATITPEKLVIDTVAPPAPVITPRRKRHPVAVYPERNLG